MDIVSILEEKQRGLLETGNPLKVDFTMSEINALADVNELRRLKLVVSFPNTFEQSQDIFDCTKRVIEGDTLYRILEFCVLKNKVLRMPVKQVFNKIV